VDLSRLRWAGHAGSIKDVVGWKRPLGIPRHIGRIMLNWILQNKDVIKCRKFLY
jgi:hypothetical protein